MPLVNILGRSDQIHRGHFRRIAIVGNSTKLVSSTRDDSVSHKEAFSPLSCPLLPPPPPRTRRLTSASSGACVPRLHSVLPPTQICPATPPYKEGSVPLQGCPGNIRGHVRPVPKKQRLSFPCISDRKSAS